MERSSTKVSPRVHLCSFTDWQAFIKTVDILMKVGMVGF